MEHREAEFADHAHVAHETVGDGARCAAGARGGGEEFSPGRDPARAAAAEHHHVAGLEVVDDADLELVGILAGGDPGDFLEAPGAREAGEHEAVVEGTHRRRHRLLPRAEFVEHVG